MGKNLVRVTSSIAVFFQKVDNIHFNYEGIEFYNVHKMTEALYDKLLKHYDDFSEKIRMSKTKVAGSFREHLENSFIEESTQKDFTLNEVIEILTNDLSKLIVETKKIESTATIQPMLDEFYLTCDKWHWFFNSMKRK